MKFKVRKLTSIKEKLTLIDRESPGVRFKSKVGQDHFENKQSGARTTLKFITSLNLGLSNATSGNPYLTSKISDLDEQASLNPGKLAQSTTLTSLAALARDSPTKRCRCVKKWCVVSCSRSCAVNSEPCTEAYVCA